MANGQNGMILQHHIATVPFQRLHSADFALLCMLSYKSKTLQQTSASLHQPANRAEPAFNRKGNLQ